MAKKANTKKSSNPRSKKKVDASELSGKQRFYILLFSWLVVFTPLLSIALVLWTVGDDDLPSTEELENPKSDEASLILDVNGKTLGTYFVSNRVKVDYPDLSPYLVDALVSTEDERYWDHSGVDGWALGRAISGMGSKGGGSTITQQLAKMMFHEPAKSAVARMKQKFAEWKIAVRLENNYTKEEIIAMYFNEFDFLNQAVGVDQACKVYFNTTPKDIKIEEAAVLVGMFKSPTGYNPKSKPEKSKKRRDQVLFQMKRNDKITQVQYDSLIQIPLSIDFKRVGHEDGKAPYFRAQIKNKVKYILANEAEKDLNGDNYNMYTDGLKIYTSLDAKMQSYAEWAVEEHLANELQKALDKDIKKNKNWPFSNAISKSTRNKILNLSMTTSPRYKALKKQGLSDSEIEENFNTKTKLKVFDWKSKKHLKEVEMTPMDSIKYHLSILKASLVAIDPHTGYVKAYVGGPDYKLFKYDYATQAKRQVGSTIKPFVYASAIESGALTPCDEAPMIKYCLDLENGTQWCPGGEKELDGTMTPVYFGLAASSNPFTAYVVKKMGGKNERVVEYFKKMGIENSTLKPVPSLALGTCDLSVMELTSAHALFSDYGMFHKPITVLRIEDRNGKTIWEADVQVTQVMSKTSAFEVLKMMKGVTGVKRPADGKAGGTARRLRFDRPYAFNGVLAGKTGTTQNNMDGWFVGHTPDLVTGVWVGCESQAVRFNSTYYGQGANTGLPIWGYFMKKVYADKSIKINKGDFNPPYDGQPTSIECQEKQDLWGNSWPAGW